MSWLATSEPGSSLAASHDPTSARSATPGTPVAPIPPDALRVVLLCPNTGMDAGALASPELAREMAARGTPPSRESTLSGGDTLLREDSQAAEVVRERAPVPSPAVVPPESCHGRPSRSSVFSSSARTETRFARTVPPTRASGSAADRAEELELYACVSDPVPRPDFAESVRRADHIPGV